MSRVVATDNLVDEQLLWALYVEFLCAAWRAGIMVICRHLVVKRVLNPRKYGVLIVYMVGIAAQDEY
ncbi:hypothetical protein BDV30DRAFT_211460 [Aspergillus minisclerotigenes]|uniref:Uncharacterized protein n=1 Tax=Aspergillus minisclerotigenes TaxID=656917 RepID=A0A5N6J466_9EURO|nr:hypothetical protein BDV30DRAFT_211460 [Aspergillus minisclerotigenes]